MRLEFKPPDLNPVVSDFEMLEIEFRNMTAGLLENSDGDVFQQRLTHFFQRYKSLNESEKAHIESYVGPVRKAFEKLLTIRCEEQGIPPLNFSAFSFVALILVVIVLDETVMTKYFKQEGHWGESLNMISELVDDDA